ncbi:hypothetical protein [Celeribacter sp. SCSIO 80788]|uniref:hypothetical protein n=1 Tax=Celeribacter sp. SCSIO 80788 TaxID=3117013 RepID=UPI003DA653B0
MDASIRKRVIYLAKLAVEHFNVGDWQALGAYTGQLDLISNHDRLLRSLSFGDADYSGHAHAVIFRIVEFDRDNLQIIEDYIAENYGVGGVSISTAPTHQAPITFAPSVFEIPKGQTEADLVAVMSPFSAPFEMVFQSIQSAATATGLRCLRAKDIWEHSSVIQDVFSLIYKAQIVVCDFTGKNPNVFYEAGIAHTLGKHVVPITQNSSDIPFDLQHHRYLSYLNNSEGRASLENELQRRFGALK